MRHGSLPEAALAWFNRSKICHELLFRRLTLRARNFLNFLNFFLGKFRGDASDGVRRGCDLPMVGLFECRQKGS